MPKVNKSNYKKNSLIYLLENPLDWFFVPVAVWVLIWRQYLSFGQIATITGIGLTVELLLELPSGAFADLLGRKVTIILGRVIKVIGYLILFIARNYWLFLIGWIFYQINEAFYSGSGDALLYDSLKENKKEEKFTDIRSKTFTYCTLGLATASLIGSVLFNINHTLPYLFAAITSTASFFLVLFYEEPLLDTEKFNLKTYTKQNIEGFKHIFSTNTLKLVTLFSISVLVVSFSGTWYFHQQLASSYGFQASMLGILFFTLYIVRAVSSSYLRKFLKQDKQNNFPILIALGLAFSYIFSIGANIIRGGIMLGVKFLTDGITWPVTSIIQNKFIESKYRATALSAISLLTNIMLALAGPLFGWGIENFGVRTTVCIVGVLGGLVSIPIAIKLKTAFNTPYTASL